MTDEEIMELCRAECEAFRWPSSAIFIARAIEAKVRDECKAEWQKGFDEGTIAGYESGQMDMREECAVICEIEADELRDGGWFDYSLVALDCAEAIRDRGKNE